MASYVIKPEGWLRVLQNIEKIRKNRLPHADLRVSLKFVVNLQGRNV